MLIKIDNNKPQKEIINRAVQILRQGGVLIVPTETAYGLSCDATNKQAVKRIYKLKGRSFKKFLPLIVNNLSQLKKYFRLNKQELGLFKKYKGLSVVLGVRDQGLGIRGVYLLPGQKTCAVRISPNQVIQALTKKLGRPITATSANRTGAGNCYSVKEVLDQFKKLEWRDSSRQNSAINCATPLIDLILDGGKLKKRKPSTIVRVSGDKIKVLRQGEVRLRHF